MDEFGGLVLGWYELKIYCIIMDDYGDFELVFYYVEGELGLFWRIGGKSVEVNGKLWIERGFSCSGKGLFLKLGVLEFGIFWYYGLGEEREVIMWDNVSFLLLSWFGILSELFDRVGDGVGVYSDDVVLEERNDVMKEIVGYFFFWGFRWFSRLY